MSDMTSRPYVLDSSAVGSEFFTLKMSSSVEHVQTCDQFVVTQAIGHYIIKFVDYVKL